MACSICGEPTKRARGREGRHLRCAECEALEEALRRCRVYATAAMLEGGARTDAIVKNGRRLFRILMTPAAHLELEVARPVVKALPGATTRCCICRRRHLWAHRYYATGTRGRGRPPATCEDPNHRLLWDAIRGVARHHRPLVPGVVAYVDASLTGIIVDTLTRGPDGPFRRGEDHVPAL